MLSRSGLRLRMAVSYVLVSAAAVLVVEAVVLAVMVPGMLSARDSVEQAQQRAAEAEAGAVQSKAERAALEMATEAGNTASKVSTNSPGRSDEELLRDAISKRFDVQKSGSADTDVLQVLATVDGRVIVGIPDGVLARNSTLPAAVTNAHGGLTTVDGRTAGWATSPVTITDEAGAGRRVIGIAYARLVVPSAEDAAAAGKKSGTAGIGIGSLIVPGAIVLGLLVPVGAQFGRFSTGLLIRRIRRLAEGASAMADGDLRARIPVSGGDEVGHLEQAFNSMAERLDAAVEVQRRTAGIEARRAERTRITRELHDSISQDLFSASLIAGGLRKALPASSALRHQAESLELSLERTKREMRAMLLELRPVALEETCLAEALEELCRAYETRLGIAISASIDPVRLDAPVEHAVLRVVQEALGNAVRHGEPGAVELRVTGDDGRVSVTVHDDGRGFDPLATAGSHGMGLELMRGRVGELGGTVEVLSAPQRGTTVRVLLPGGAA
jgi:signal transduction histidine kinase